MSFLGRSISRNSLWTWANLIFSFFSVRYLFILCRNQIRQRQKVFIIGMLRISSYSFWKFERILFFFSRSVLLQRFSLFLCICRKRRHRASSKIMALANEFALENCLCRKKKKRKLFSSMTRTLLHGFRLKLKSDNFNFLGFSFSSFSTFSCF